MARKTAKDAKIYSDQRGKRRWREGEIERARERNAKDM